MRSSSSAASLLRAQRGDRRALEAFFAHHLPRLRAWTRARVPRWLERRTDADDLVQLTAVRGRLRVASANTARVVTRRAIDRLVKVMSVGIRD